MFTLWSDFAIQFGTYVFTLWSDFAIRFGTFRSLCVHIVIWIRDAIWNLEITMCSHCDLNSRYNFEPMCSHCDLNSRNDFETWYHYVFTLWSEFAKRFWNLISLCVPIVTWIRDLKITMCSHCDLNCPLWVQPSTKEQVTVSLICHDEAILYILSMSINSTHTQSRVSRCRSELTHFFEVLRDQLLTEDPVDTMSQ